MARKSSQSSRVGGGGGNVVLDKPVAWALLSLALVYSTVTVFTYQHVAASDQTMITAVSTAATGVAAASNHKNRHPNDYTIYALQHESFPLHVKEETTETIEHPGAPYIKEGTFPADVNAHSLRVPMFFDKAYGGVYNNQQNNNHNNSIRQYLGNFGERLITKQEALSIGSFDSQGRETIYASVASYRDPECAGTVADLFERAEYPQRIRVAIVEQRLASRDTVCTTPPVDCATDPKQALCQYAHLIDYFEMDARLGVGPVFARHLAHRHYRGEYFAMQIDSHVRFTEHWDTDIIKQWKSAKNEMAILTAYPSDITDAIDPETHKSQHPSRPIMCASDFEGSGAKKHLRHGQQPEGRPGIVGQPTLHPFWAAGFSFARGHFVIQVPYDQYLPMVFQGEEISIGMRAFTHGYDFYAAERGVCFHMYAIKENKERRKNIPKFWENGQMYSHAGEPSMKRLNTLIKMKDWPEDEWPQNEKEYYTLGKVRQPDKFFKTFGIHLEEEKVEGHLCRFVGKPMMKVFLPALRSDGMGIDYDKIDYEFKDPAPDEKQGIW